jgi:hypothetical protein
MDPKRELLRHALATVAYRAGKALRDAPESFPQCKVSESSRTPLQIVSHMGDLFVWALLLSQGGSQWKPEPPRTWDAEVSRLSEALRRFDLFLAGDEPVVPAIDTLFQGPVADALTHVGQLTMLRRMAGAPVPGENYFKAPIAPGQILH